MTLMQEIRAAIQAERLPPIFCTADLKAEGIDDPNNNLSNYDKKNSGSSNKNKKVLVSRVLGNVTYYTFDKQLFP